MDEVIRKLYRRYQTGDVSVAIPLYQALVRNGYKRSQINEMLGADQIIALMRAGMLNPDPETLDTFKREIRDAAETIIREEANGRAAQAWSFTEDPDIWLYANFGQAEAVNGDLLRMGDGSLVDTEEKYQERRRHPGNFVNSGKGGDVPETEEEISIEFVIEMVSKQTNINENLVSDILTKENKNREHIYTSVSGRTREYHPDKKLAVYAATDLAELREATENLNFDEFDGLDWDRVPRWGRRNRKILDWIDRGDRWRGLLSWNTRNPNDRKYLFYYVSYSNVTISEDPF